MVEYLYNSYPRGCPCGFYGDPVKECSCSAMAIARYQKKISGPLLDRIDIHVEVPPRRLRETGRQATGRGFKDHPRTSSDST